MSERDLYCENLLRDQGLSDQEIAEVARLSGAGTLQCIEILNDIMNDENSMLDDDQRIFCILSVMASVVNVCELTYAKHAGCESLHEFILNLYRGLVKMRKMSEE